MSQPFDLGLRNLNNDFLQGVRTGFHVIDVADDHVDTMGGADNVDSRISNRTYIKRTLFYQRQLGRFSGRFGTELKFRDFHATGAEVLAPRTDQSTLSAFGYEELTFGRYRLQVAGRVERNDYRTAGRVALPGYDDADDHDDDADDHDHGHDHDADEDEHDLGPPDPRDRQFLGMSGSVGLHADLGAATAFVANLMQTHRVPALQELYNFGPHLGNFEVGDFNMIPGQDVSNFHHLGGDDLMDFVSSWDLQARFSHILSAGRANLLDGFAISRTFSTEYIRGSLRLFPMHWSMDLGRERFRETVSDHLPFVASFRIDRSRD